MTDTPASAPVGGGKRIELTLRALLLGCLLAVVFTAANTYMGLRTGLTFASAIPAAVISMALLRAFKSSTIWENMTVQTVASVGGAMSSVVFVLPGLVLIGAWQEFPIWESIAICLLGGILGVTFSIPLRRALVTNGGLPYPEGVAAAEVLEVGSRGAAQSEAAVRENKSGLWIVVGGAIVSGAYALAGAAKVFAEEATRFVKLPAALGGGATGIGLGMQFALLGAGHLIGLTVGLAQLFGLMIAWLIIVPIMTSPDYVTWTASMDLESVAGGLVGSSPEELASMVWRNEVRFMGAGVIAVAAIWTLIKLAGPLVGGLTSALAAQAKRTHGDTLERSEQDIPINWVGLISALCLTGIAVLLVMVAQAVPALAGSTAALLLGGLIYVVVIGFAVAAICGYMAGLIGSSNSPVSGVGILAIIIASLFMLGVMQIANVPADPAFVSYALIVTAIVFAVAVIANDNLQDLKTGQLIGATPWRQQTALIVGVVAGAIVIPFVLNWMNQGFGFEGGPAPIGGGTDDRLAAPQATLISALAKGVIQSNLRWDLIGVGAAIGVAIIVLDFVLTRATKGKIKLPPLAVGIGFYLPAAITMMLVVGAVCGWLYEKTIRGTRFADVGRRMGVLLAAGLIVGESLFGVFRAGLIVQTGNKEIFEWLPEGSAWPAMPIGLVVFAGLAFALYAWVRRQSAKV